MKIRGEIGLRIVAFNCRRDMEMEGTESLDYIDTYINIYTIYTNMLCTGEKGSTCGGGGPAACGRGI